MAAPVPKAKVKDEDGIIGGWASVPYLPEKDSPPEKSVAVVRFVFGAKGSSA
jgi:hypothetical protein